jgi:hypothetical protein
VSITHIRLAESRRAARAKRICANEACGLPIPVERLRARFCSKQCQRTNSAMRAYQCAINRKRLYGISVDEFGALLEAQGGLCAVCKADVPGGKGNWHVDHDHTSGAVRGLLCHHCNLMLGNAGDDPVRLREAADYLEKEQPCVS